MYLLAFFIPICAMVLGFVLNSVFPFGDKSALIIDGVHQYLGFYQELIHQLGQAGDFWHATHALGYNFFSVFAYYLASPFNLIVLFLNRFLNINEAVTIVILLKIGLTSVSMAWYVKKRFALSNYKALPIAAMYGLSNFIVGYYSNLMWLDAVMILPILAYMIEEILEQKHYKGYTLVLFYCIFTNYYMGFMICIFATLYFMALTILKKPAWKELLKSWVGFGIHSVLAAGMSAVILVPSIYAIKLTQAGNEAGLNFKNQIFQPLDDWSQQLSRFFYESFPYATSGNQGSVNIYCGILVFVFVILFLLSRKISKREKICWSGLLILYFCGFHFPLLNLVLHGLHKPVGMPNRFGFVFTFLILRVGAMVFSNMEEYRRKNRVVAFSIAIVVTIILAVCIQDELIWVTVLGLALYFIIWESSETYEKIGIWRFEIQKEQIRKLFYMLIIAEMLTHTVLSIAHMGAANRTVYFDWKKEVQTLAADVKEQSGYRTVLAYSTLRNEELLYDMNGSTFFSSTISQDVIDSLYRLGYETGKNRYQYAGSTELMDALLGVKYIIYNKDMTVPEYYKKVSETDHFVMYENANAISNGFVVQKDLTEIKLQGNNPFEVQNKLVTQLGFSELYHTQEVTESINDKKSDASSYTVTLKKGEHGYIYVPGGEPNIVKIDGKTFWASRCNNKMLDLGYAETERFVDISIVGQNHKIVMGTYLEGDLNAMIKTLTTANQYPDESGDVMVYSKQGTYLFNSTYQEGMKVTVDGVEKQVININGFAAVDIEDSYKVLHVQYKVKGLQMGIRISIISLLCFLLLSSSHNMYTKIRGKLKERRQ
ncbi:MAG: YfhO family protein [Hespellia sp.]|nr:YfhO family protein [Hespellia sp.]